MVEKIYRQVETIEREGELYNDYKKYKSERSWINAQLLKAIKKENYELQFIFKELLKIHNHFYPSKEVDVEVESWKGHSSFNIVRGLDKITIIKFQRKSRGETPQEIRTEVTKEQISAVIDALKRLDNGKPINTPKIAMLWSEILNLHHSGWSTGSKPFFSDRKTHNLFTLLLGALDSMGLIVYRGGQTTVLNKNISLQRIL